MAPARESGTASAAVGGALWAAATCDPPLPLLLMLLAGELGDTLLAALEGEGFPFGISGAAAGAAAGFEPVVSPFDLVSVEDDEDGDEDIGTCSGCATSVGCAAGLFFFWGVATQKGEASQDQKSAAHSHLLSRRKGKSSLTCDVEYRRREGVTKIVFHLKVIPRLCVHARSGSVNTNVLRFQLSCILLEESHRRRTHKDA